MATERNVVDFKIHNLTEEQFQELKAQGKIDPNAVYCTPDESLKRNQITNCITEIPQDIKLELADGVLTLKAGSKYYRLDGSSSERDSDYVFSNTWGSAATGIAFIGQPGGQYQFYPLERTHSGTQFPTGLTGNSHVFFNTSDNLVYFTKNAGTDWVSSEWASLPLAIVTWGADNKISSIDQVFNGFGYVGSTVFVLPGVKGLMPNGRNEDGTLKNTNAVSGNVYTYTRTAATNPNIALTMARGGYLEPSSLITYDAEKNIHTISGTPIQKVVVGRVSFGDGGKITSFEPKPTFHAVDYSDFEELDNSVVHKTGNETIDGKKSFTENIIFKRDTDQSVLPTNNQYYTWSTVQDKNGKYLSYIETVRFSTGDVSQAFGARREDSNGTQHTASITVKVNADFTKSFRLSESPASTSNGTDVATTEWVNAKFLPLAGGTMSGTITRNGTLLAKRNVDDSYLELDGGTTYLNGAYLRLDGKDSSGTPGQFRLATSDGSKNIALTGKTDGSLLWDGLPIVITEGKTFAQKSYVKFNNGLIVQWGRIAEEAASKTDTISFATPFLSANVSVQIETMAVNNSYFVRPTSITSSNFTYAVDKPGSSNADPTAEKTWIAIGY